MEKIHLSTLMCISSDGATDQNGEEDSSLGWLEEIDISKDLKMNVIEYLGPQVIEG